METMYKLKTKQRMEVQIFCMPKGVQNCTGRKQVGWYAVPAKLKVSGASERSRLYKSIVSSLNRILGTCR